MTPTSKFGLIKQTAEQAGTPEERTSGRFPYRAPGGDPPAPEHEAVDDTEGQLTTTIDPEPDAPAKRQSTKPQSSRPSRRKRAAADPPNEPERIIGSPSPWGGPTRILDLNVGQQAADILTNPPHNRTRTQAMLLAVGFYADEVVAENPTIDMPGGFSNRRPARKRQSVPNRRVVRVSVMTDDAVELMRIMSDTELSTSAFIDACLVKWAEAGAPLSAPNPQPKP